MYDAASLLPVGALLPTEGNSNHILLQTCVEFEIEESASLQTVY
jgi:hypothetical protein